MNAPDNKKTIDCACLGSFWLLPAIVQNGVLPRLRLASNIKALSTPTFASTARMAKNKVMSVIDKQENSLAVLLLLGTAFSAVSCHT